MLCIERSNSFHNILKIEPTIILYLTSSPTLFRAKLLKALVENNLQVPKDCPNTWVVDCKSVGNGDKAFIYLGKYLYKSVIQEKDILQCDDTMVTFRYICSKTKKYQIRTVAGEHFL